MTHKVKLDISFCDAVYQGIKTFEVRNNDRGYQKGDLIQFLPVGEHLCPVEHPIRDKTYEITYVLSGWGIKEGYCVFAIKESEATNEC